MKKIPKLFQQRSEVVYSVEDSVISISKSDIDFLRQVAEKSSLQKARVLLHGSPDEELHEMLIVHSLGQYIQPHINLNSSKSFVVLEGEMAVVLFNNEGAIDNHIQLSASDGATAFLLRLGNPVFHTIIPISTTVVFLETVKGPHIDTHYAPFAPSPNDRSESDKYMAWLTNELAIG